MAYPHRILNMMLNMCSKIKPINVIKIRSFQDILKKMKITHGVKKDITNYVLDKSV